RAVLERVPVRECSHYQREYEDNSAGNRRVHHLFRRTLGRDYGDGDTGDSTRRRSILVHTALLPERRRVWRRQRLAIEGTGTQAMKKLMNAADSFVDEMLVGLCAAHPTLKHEGRVIRAAHAPRKGRVGIVSGGGSGHLPLFTGYVGEGL